MVDRFVPNADKCEVYCANTTSYACNLSFTDCVHNNNKFYIMQIIKNGTNFTLFIRYGRIGVDGVVIDKPYGSNSSGALKEYNKILRTKLNYGYTHVATVAVKDPTPVATKGKKTEVKSKLHPKLQELMNFITNMKDIEKSVVEIGYDIKKLPLGQLTDDTIKKGASKLKEIEDAIKAKSNSTKLAELSNEFYRIIPHDFGFQNMSNFIIKDLKTVHEKMNMVQSLKDIAVTAKVSKIDSKSTKHELD